ncbi:molybdate ABC transporter substrate-binding protein [Amycolatopsis thermalba]|uniref:Molybdate ABC transporter substrate-binding protein n=1 Tax=Amycolatopsis thermalba TaxID=944492 RepID=A0ABY4P592_9PSEU|nr:MULTISPECIES: molybdate ABC transporter substrate-binding protein [Amycolatopsis]UQS27456.1 molybdate ABC transporter substrate-binding protein [Amycolatopsis thermalba]
MTKAGALVAVALLVAGCGSSGGSESGTLTVFAAASLTESFTALETAFESSHPGTDVKFNFAGSSALVQQLSNGASADVFASADQTNMDKAVQAGVIDGSPSVFATNRLAIAVAPGNPKGITSFADLAKDGLTVVVCAPQVPCGSATEKVERSTGVTLKPASEEQDVKQVLNKVQTGDADAGLVYVTDAASAAGKVDRVDFPEAAAAINSYPIAVVEDAPQSELAKQWVAFVLGEQGRTELRKAGFGAP